MIQRIWRWGGQMRSLRRTIISGLLLLSFCFLGEGLAKDHPLIKPYPGSTGGITSEREFDAYELILGPIKDQKLTKSQHLEGKVTVVRYSTPAGRSNTATSSIPPAVK